MAHYPNRRSSHKQENSREARPQETIQAARQLEEKLLVSEMITDERARMQEIAMEEPERWDGLS